MNETAILADHIDDHVGAILTAWRSTIDRVGNVPTALQLSNGEFVDHVPEILRALADRLRGKHSDASTPGRKHGQQRWALGYDISQVLNELGHLRSSLIRGTFEYVQARGYDLQVLEDATVAINEVIDQAAAESARRYQDDSLAKTLDKVLQSREREAVSDADRSQLRTLLEHLPVGVWVVDDQNATVTVNREAERLQGFSDRSLAGGESPSAQRPLAQLRLLDRSGSRGDDENPLVLALRGVPTLQREYSWPGPTRVRFLTVNAAPLLDDQGKVVGAVAVAQDISERKLLETNLAINEARTRALVDQSPVLIWRTDANGQTDFFNRTWLEFRGRSTELEAGEGWYQGIHPDDCDRRRARFQTAFHNREPFEIDFRLRHADGTYRWVSERGAPYHDARGIFLGYLGSCLDITGRIELEERLVEQSQHKSRLMSALSHDARTPLNAVVLSADLLQAQFHDQEEPEVQESLRTIRNAVRNVLDLLSDLLDLTRLDAGATTADRSTFAIQTTLAECLSSIEPQARAKGLDV